MIAPAYAINGQALSNARISAWKMNDQPELPDSRKQRRKTYAKRAVHLTGQEYLPMLATIAFWALSAFTIGHADTARLIAVTVILRAVIMLASLSSSGPLRRRLNASHEVLGKSRRNVLLMELGSLGMAAALVAAITMGFETANRSMLALMLPLCALSLPVRSYRGIDPRANPIGLRLAIALGTVIAGGAAWALFPAPAGMALAYGAREWLALILTFLFFTNRLATATPTDEVLKFPEVARNTVVGSRRRLAFRLTKNILAVFGPFGNVAARTGRGLQLDKKLEPYMPHNRTGFTLFALVTGGAATALLMLSSKPVAALVAAAMFQLCAIAMNILILWRYLPKRDDPNLVIVDDDDE